MLGIADSKSIKTLTNGGLSASSFNSASGVLAINVPPQGISSVLETSDNASGASIIGLGTLDASNFTGITETIGVTVNNNGSVITTGILGVRPLTHNYTITGYQIVADIPGSITFSIGICTFANYPTFTSIVASAPPALNSARSVASTTLTGWTTILAAGGFLQFGVTSATTVTNVTLVLQVVRS